MALREKLEHARELAENEYQEAGRKLPKSKSKLELEAIQKAVKVIAEEAAGQFGLKICYVYGIESYCLHSWDDDTFIALTETGQLLSVYKEPANARKRGPSRFVQKMINITATDLDNIDKYFGPLIDKSATVDI